MRLQIWSNFWIMYESFHQVIISFIVRLFYASHSSPDEDTAYVPQYMPQA